MVDDQQLPAHSRRSTAVRLQSAITLDDLSPAWAWGGATGAGVRVAVLDSGIEADHPAVGEALDREGSMLFRLARPSGEVQAIPGPHPDAFGHGTACAGVIHQLAPEATITSVCVLDGRLSAKTEVFVAGLRWAIDQGFDVINLSLGTRKRDWALAFYELCDEAYFRGTLVVTAANNFTAPSYPSLYGSVVSVACNLSQDPYRFHYNPDPPVEFLAPGVDVDLAWKGGRRIRGTGNSYAAPHIAGIAALIRSKHPELRPFQVKTVLWATAANVREAPRPAGRISRTMRRSTVTGRATRSLIPQPPAE